MSGSLVPVNTDRLCQLIEGGAVLPTRLTLLIDGIKSSPCMPLDALVAYIARMSSRQCRQLTLQSTSEHRLLLLVDHPHMRLRSYLNVTGFSLAGYFAELELVV